MSSHKKLSDRGTMQGKMNDSILVREIRRMIEEARSAVAVTVNAGLTMLYWRIGRRINEEVLKGERANYGEEIISTLSGQLTREYGNGFSYSALTRMVKFAESFPDPKIVATLSQTLSWSHFRWLDKYERQSGEGAPIGIILCAGKKAEQIELLELNQSGIHVAEYLTVLPPRKILQDKLHKAIEQSRLRLSGGRNE